MKLGKWYSRLGGSFVISKPFLCEPPWWPFWWEWAVTRHGEIDGGDTFFAFTARLHAIAALRRMAGEVKPPSIWQLMAPIEKVLIVSLFVIFVASAIYFLRGM